MIFPEEYPTLQLLLIKGTMEDLLRFIEENKPVSMYLQAHWIRIKNTLILEEIARRGLIIVK